MKLINHGRLAYLRVAMQIRQKTVDPTSTVSIEARDAVHLTTEEATAKDAFTRKSALHNKTQAGVALAPAERLVIEHAAS